MRVGLIEGRVALLWRRGGTMAMFGFALNGRCGTRNAGPKTQGSELAAAKTYRPPPAESTAEWGAMAVELSAWSEA